MFYATHLIVFGLYILAGYDDVFAFGANVFASKTGQHTGSRNSTGV